MVLKPGLWTSKTQSYTAGPNKNIQSLMLKRQHRGQGVHLACVQPQFNANHCCIWPPKHHQKWCLSRETDVLSTPRFSPHTKQNPKMSVIALLHSCHVLSFLNSEMQGLNPFRQKKKKIKLLLLRILSKYCILQLKTPPMQRLENSPVAYSPQFGCRRARFDSWHCKE